MKILVFTEGTAIKHPSQEQFLDVVSFIPTEGTLEKLKKWRGQGADICYLTSVRCNQNQQTVEATLQRFNFPAGELYCRQEGENYVDVVGRVRPDVLIEDDCKSIGWDEVITPKLKTEWGIKGIVVPEHDGLGHLPDDHGQLRVADAAGT